MNYLTFGREKNPVIVFLHGWGGSVASWLGVAKTMARIGFYSVVLDFAGFGKSPEPTKVYGVEDYAQDVENLINKLNLKNVTIVGHSFGGRVAIMLSARHEIDIKKLILVDSAGVLPKRGLKYKYKVYKYKRLKKLVNAGKESAEKLDRYGSSDYKTLTPLMKQVFIKVVNQDLLPFATKINVQTLLIWGKKDKDTPLYMAKKLRKAISGSRLIVYQAGHYCYLDNYAEFVDDLYAFIVI